jgi:Mg/Co/Ni transporter MgtE
MSSASSHKAAASQSKQVRKTMALVKTELLDKLYEEATKNKTEFFMRILEDPDYRPTLTELKADIDKELAQATKDAETLKAML